MILGCHCLAACPLTRRSPGCLHLPALAAKGKPWSLGALIRDFEDVAGLTQLAKVNIAKCDPSDEFETERDIGGTNLPRFLDVFGFKVRQELAHVELWFAIVGTVVDADTRVVAVCDGLP